jgi:uncharacterized protein (DUF433 family)
MNDLLILEQHIVSTPDVRSGRPRIDGTGITVEDVAIWHVYQGRPAEQIASDFDLTLGQIHAALAFYYDHKLELDQSIAADLAFHAQMNVQSQTKLAKIRREREG